MPRRLLNTIISPTIHYELTNHLGNVMAVITDEPTATETPTVESLTDYYPFGMTMPGRSYNAHTSRHGFTGHEKESDLAEGIYTTEYRLYDTRVGRWLSVDPLFEKYVGMSPYNYCIGNPVKIIDPTGMEGYEVNNETGEYWWNPDVTAENVAEGFTYIPTEEMLDEVVVNLPKNQKYGELFTGMTDNPLNFGTAVNVRYGGDATEHGESGATSLLQVVKNFINGVADLWRTNFGKNDENPISNNSSQNNSAKDNFKIKSDTVVKKSYSVRTIKKGSGIFDFRQEEDTIISTYVNDQLINSDTIIGDKPPRAN